MLCEKSQTERQMLNVLSRESLFESICVYVDVQEVECPQKRDAQYEA